MRERRRLTNGEDMVEPQQHVIVGRGNGPQCHEMNVQRKCLRQRRELRIERREPIAAATLPSGTEDEERRVVQKQAADPLLPRGVARTVNNHLVHRSYWRRLVERFSDTAAKKKKG